MLGQRHEQLCIAVADDMPQLVIGGRRIERHDADPQCVERQQVQVHLEPTVESQGHPVARFQAAPGIARDQLCHPRAGSLVGVFDRPVSIRVGADRGRAQKRSFAESLHGCGEGMVHTACVGLIDRASPRAAAAAAVCRRWTG